MMNDIPNEDGSPFQPHTDPELRSILEYTDVMRPDSHWVTLGLKDDSEPSPI
jgi:hypothetical protein